ncbi:MAG: hypothetical protein ACO4AG_10910, partial [Candidatus Nanopelagicales bacterium]
ITSNNKIYNESSTCSAQTGGPGFTIDVDRIFYEGDVEVRRETFTTTYRPAPQVVCGKKPDKNKDKDKDKEDGGDPAPEPTDAPTEEPTEEPGDGPGDAPIEGESVATQALGPIRGTSQR